MEKWFIKGQHQNARDRMIVWAIKPIRIWVNIPSQSRKSILLRLCYSEEIPFDARRHILLVPWWMKNSRVIEFKPIENRVLSSSTILKFLPLRMYWCLSRVKLCRLLGGKNVENGTLNFSNDLEHQNKLMRTEVNFLMIRRTSKGVYRPCRITCPLTTCFTEPTYQTTELDVPS